MSKITGDIDGLRRHKHDFKAPDWDKPRAEQVIVKCATPGCSSKMIFPAIADVEAEQVIVKCSTPGCATKMIFPAIADVESE